ncbi:MAG: EthD domain-containing protein [Syntrophorhabdaceae bacterium]|nr:EthD domain-containing protein [Syntrophorhabdaceae bacterium]
MPKVIACSRRRPGLTKADYFRYLQFIHGTISHKFSRPEMGWYTQNHVIDSAFGTTKDSTYGGIANRDAAVELSFASFPDLYACFMHPDVVKWVASDGKFFADEPNTIVMITEEYEKPVPNPLDTFNPGYGLASGVGAGKVMQFLRRAEGVFLDDFYQYWNEAHEYAMENAPYCRKELRRYVQSHRLAQSDNVKAHFGTVNVPDYDGVASYWFDTPYHLSAFREYNEALMNYEKRWCDWSMSFYLFVKEVPIHYKER